MMTAADIKKEISLRFPPNKDTPMENMTFGKTDQPTNQDISENQASTNELPVLINMHKLRNGNKVGATFIDQSWYIKLQIDSGIVMVSTDFKLSEEAGRKLGEILLKNMLQYINQHRSSLLADKARQAEEIKLREAVISNHVEEIARLKNTISLSVVEIGSLHHQLRVAKRKQRKTKKRK